MLSPTELANRQRGRTFKRYVRAAAALAELYEDQAIADAVGVGRGAVRGWWRGAEVKLGNLQALAERTGLSVDELTQFVYFAGPPPGLPDPEWATERAERAEELAAVRESLREVPPAGTRPSGPVPVLPGDAPKR